MLTARDAVPDRIRGLDSGSDDYVVKPIDLDELAARLRAPVRRAHGQPQEWLQVQDVQLDPAGRTVTRDSQAVALSTREFDLLHALMLAAGRVLSREQLEQQLYSWGNKVDSNAVEVHMHHLRKKLGASFNPDRSRLGLRLFQLSTFQCLHRTSRGARGKPMLGLRQGRLEGGDPG